MKSWGKTIKCPFCGNEGVSILEQGRLMFSCYTCGNESYLKTINQKQNKKLIVHNF